MFAPDRGVGVGGGAGGEALLGRWETTLVLSLPPDLQTWTTRWTFEAGGDCQYRQTVVSLLEGTTRVKERDCTWRTANATVTITWDDTGLSEALPYSFPAFDPNRLVLQGIEYRRTT